MGPGARPLPDAKAATSARKEMGAANQTSPGRGQLAEARESNAAAHALDPGSSGCRECAILLRCGRVGFGAAVAPG